MSNLTLSCKEVVKPHPEGVHNAVCVDVIDLGPCDVEFQGTRKTVEKVRVVFESEAVEEGKRCTVSKSFTASLHPKAKLAEFLGKWRGRPVLPGETIDLRKLIGVSCTLMISHQSNMVGRVYASIDAVSKPAKKVAPSGQYDPAETRKRIAEAKAKETGGASPARTGAAQPQAAAPKSAAAQPAAEAEPEFDPEVGF